jgi:hypothetical protein
VGGAMSKAKKGIALGLILMAASAWAASSLILDSLTPNPPKKLPEGYGVESGAYHFRDARLDLQVAQLTSEERVRFYAAKKLPDPFSGVLPIENLILLRLRIENLQKENTLEFSPTATMLGNCLAFDDTYVYQFLYREHDAAAKLDAAGKTMFLKHLSLPPGTWIERLLAFQYDDPYPSKKILLVVGGISAGAEGVDLAFPFKATYRKEKKK